MATLEEEFQLLMKGVIAQINDKQTKGELSKEEADALIELVGSRMVDPETRTINAWQGSNMNCYEDQDYDYDDRAWNRSGVSC